MKLNLSGMYSYTSSRPWVFNVRVDDTLTTALNLISMTVD